MNNDVQKRSIIQNIDDFIKLEENFVGYNLVILNELEEVYFFSFLLFFK